jgi:hypothetical protein
MLKMGSRLRIRYAAEQSVDDWHITLFNEVNRHLSLLFFNWG